MDQSPRVNARVGFRLRLELLDAKIQEDPETRVKYLTQGNDIRHWDIAEKVITEGLFITFPSGKEMISSMDEAALRTEKYIVRAFRAEQLDYATIVALGRRWNNLDLCYENCLSYFHDMKRKSSSW